MRATRENYRAVLHHLRGFGIDPETINRDEIHQAVEDKNTPLEAAEEIAYFNPETEA